MKIVELFTFYASYKTFVNSIDNYMLNVFPTHVAHLMCLSANVLSVAIIRWILLSGIVPMLKQITPR